MKKIWNVFIAVVSICVSSFIVGCGEANTSDSNLTADQSKVLKSIKEELLELSKESKDTTSKEFNLNVGGYPDVGDYNLAIYQDEDGDVWLTEVKITEVVTGKHYKYYPNGDSCGWVSYDSISKIEYLFSQKLTEKAVEISLTNESGNFKLSTVAHGKTFDYGSEASISFNQESSATLIPTFQYTNSLALVGGQDTREFNGSGKSDYFYCDLEYRPTLRKKVRVWYSGGQLKISANRYTKAVKLSLSTCGVEYRHWGDSLNINHLGGKYCAGCPL